MLYISKLNCVATHFMAPLIYFWPFPPPVEGFRWGRPGSCQGGQPKDSTGEISCCFDSRPCSSRCNGFMSMIAFVQVVIKFYEERLNWYEDDKWTTPDRTWVLAALYPLVLYPPLTVNNYVLSPSHNNGGTWIGFYLEIKSMSWNIVISAARLTNKNFRSHTGLLVA